MLEGFFRYTVDGEATDDLTREIDSIVRSNRTNEEWRVEYMYFNIIEQDANVTIHRIIDKKMAT